MLEAKDQHATRKPSQDEMHRSQRAGWLRAAVLGADDAIVSTASLLIGVAASSASLHSLFVTGVAALVAGSILKSAPSWVVTHA